MHSPWGVALYGCCGCLGCAALWRVIDEGQLDLKEVQVYITVPLRHLPPSY